jgi:diguanylate cyclase (GGDEF)-like protein
MNISPYINCCLGPLLIYALIALDCFRKEHNDYFRLFFLASILSSAAIATLADFFSRILANDVNPAIEKLVFVLIIVLFIAQSLSYSLGVVFVDYLGHQNLERTRIFGIVIGFVFAVSLILILFDIPFGYYFKLEGNIYVHGPFFWLRIFMACLPIILLLIETVLIRRIVYFSFVMLLSLFIVIDSIGVAFDILVPTSDLVWPCYAATLLYVYLYIIRNDSKRDGLTGVGNRLLFNEFIENLSRSHQSWQVIMLDLDHFKQINDTYGHAVGDDALRETAFIIRNIIRHTDFVARYGGDEFVIAVRAEYDINVVIQRLEEALAQENARGIHPYKLQVSYGAGLFSGESPEETPGAFMARIDSLMYKNKSEHYRAEGVSAPR